VRLGKTDLRPSRPSAVMTDQRAAACINWTVGASTVVPQAAPLLEYGAMGAVSPGTCSAVERPTPPDERRREEGKARPRSEDYELSAQPLVSASSGTSGPRHHRGVDVVVTDATGTCAETVRGVFDFVMGMIDRSDRRWPNDATAPRRREGCSPSNYTRFGGARCWCGRRVPSSSTARHDAAIAEAPGRRVKESVKLNGERSSPSWKACRPRSHTVRSEE